MAGTTTHGTAHINGDCDDPDFDAFYAGHMPRLLALLRQRGAKQEDAEEVAQEAALRTWLRRTTFASESGAYGFLRHVALNLLIDHYRRQAVAALPHAEFDDRPAPASACPLTAAESAEIRRDVGAALRLLAPHDRALMIDVAVHGVPADELAVRYNALPNALRQRRFRARNALRQQLAHLRPAPAVLPFALARRACDGLRSLARFWPDVWAMPASQAFGIVVVIISLAPMLSAPAQAEPSARGRVAFTTSSHRDARDQAPQPSAAPARRPSSGSIAVTDKPPSARPVSDRQKHPHVPPVCVDNTCPLGGARGDAGDVLVVHLPEPAGDRQVKQGTVPVCTLTPDAPVSECHTEGDPDYAVPPPPPPST